MEHYFAGYLNWEATAPVEFQRALQKGRLESFFGRMTGHPTCLLPFETVKTASNLVARLERGQQEIRLDQIIGSVGKFRLFTRSLMPLSASLENRWRNIYALMQGQCGYPPIEVYKAEDGYFILDGHHRASVARYLGMLVIEAYVTEWIVLPT